MFWSFGSGYFWGGEPCRLCIATAATAKMYNTSLCMNTLHAFPQKNKKIKRAPNAKPTLNLTLIVTFPNPLPFFALNVTKIINQAWPGCDVAKRWNQGYNGMFGVLQQGPDGPGLVVGTSVSGWRTFPDLRLICGWHVTTSWGKCPLRGNQLRQLSLPSLRDR